MPCPIVFSPQTFKYCYNIEIPPRVQVTGLQASGSYYLRVAAENDEGVGYYREFIEPVRPMRPKSKCFFFFYLTLVP